jgi:hypothetical protein
MADDSGNEEQQQEFKKFFADHAKSNRSTCRKCKQKLDNGVLRLAKSGYNPFGPGPLKLWHHVNCMFEVFAGQRRTTARIETPDDIEGWSDLEEEDQEEILKYLPDCKGNCHVVVQCLTALLVSKDNCHSVVQCLTALLMCKGNCHVVVQCLAALLVSVKVTAMLWCSV